MEKMKKRYFLRSISTQTLPNFVTNETALVLERIGIEACSGTPMSVRLTVRRQLKRERKNLKKRVAKCQTKNHREQIKFHGQCLCNNVSKQKADIEASSSYQSSEEIQDEPNIVQQHTPLFSFGKTESSKSLQNHLKILNVDTHATPTHKTSQNETTVSPRDSNLQTSPTCPTSLMFEDIPGLEVSEEQCPKYLQSDEYAFMANNQKQDQNEKLFAQIDNHVFLTPRPIRQPLIKMGDNCCKKMLEKLPNIGSPWINSSNLSVGPSPKTGVHQQSDVVPRTQGNVLANSPNIGKTPPLPDLLLTPNLTLGNMPSTQNVVNTPATWQIGLISPGLFLGNMETPRLFPQYQEPGVPDILQMIDDDSSTVQSFERSLSTFDNVELTDTSVADYILNICADVDKSLSTGSVHHPQPQPENDHKVSQSKGRYGKKMTADLKRALREVQRKKYEQRRLGRIVQHHSSEPSKDEIPEQLIKVGRRTRSLVKACQEMGIAKSEGDLERLFKGHTDEE